MTFLLPVSVSEGGILNIRVDIYMREKQDYRYMTIRRLIRGNAEEASKTTTYFSRVTDLSIRCVRQPGLFQTAIAGVVLYFSTPY